MIIKGLNPVHMTPLERSMGRFMRAPDGHREDAEGLDNAGDSKDDDDQSGEAEDDDIDSNTDNDDNDDQNANDDDEGSRQDARGKRTPQNGYERRIDRLTRKVAELEASKGQRGGDQPEPPTKPVVTDFDTYEDFVEALTDFKADQRITAAEQRRDAQTAETEFQKVFKQGQKAYKDWDSVVTADVEVTPPMLRAIKDSDNPADIAYYLGQHPNEADRISSLPAGKQAIAIGKIDAKFDGKQERKTNLRDVSEAPEPITPIKGARGGAEKDLDKMSADEFIRSRNKQLRNLKG